MNSIRSRAVLIAAVVFAGLILGAAYNTYARAQPDRPTRSTDLADIVELMESERLELEERLAEHRVRIAELEASAAEEAGMAESFNRELEEVRATAGLTSITGPGVIVTLADSELVPQGQDPEACLIHDFDILGVVNALFASGAEAVSVNDERIVPATAVRCAGNTILVNSRRLGNPYIVLAIGDAEALDEGIRQDDAIAPLFDTYPAVYGLVVKVERTAELTVPPYRGSLRIEHATAASTGE